MKVVFLEDVPGTARIGDIKEVKPGFARNYLLPRRLASAATPSMIKSAEQRAVKEQRLQEGRDNEARAIGERLAAQTFTITARAGQSGKLFGSVGTADVAAKVADFTNSDFDRHNVLMPEVIKDLGDYTINLRLTRNVNGTINISVVGEDGTTAADIQARRDAASAEAGATAAAEQEAAGEDEETTDDDAEA